MGCPLSNDRVLAVKLSKNVVVGLLSKSLFQKHAARPDKRFPLVVPRTVSAERPIQKNFAEWDCGNKIVSRFACIVVSILMLR